MVEKVSYLVHDDRLYCFSYIPFPDKSQCHQAKLLITYPTKIVKDAHADFQKAFNLCVLFIFRFELHAFLQVRQGSNRG